MHKNPPLYIVRLVLIVIGLAVFGLCYREYESTADIIKRHPETTIGTVISFYYSRGQTRRDSRDFLGNNGYPVVKYMTKSNETITFTSTVHNSLFSEVKRGEAVEVIYNVSDPHKASINTFYFKWFKSIFFAIIALFLLIPGMLVKQAPHS